MCQSDPSCPRSTYAPPHHHKNHARCGPPLLLGHTSSPTPCAARFTSHLQCTRPPKLGTRPNLPQCHLNYPPQRASTRVSIVRRSTRSFRALHRGDRQLEGASGLLRTVSSRSSYCATHLPRPRPLLLRLLLMPHGHHPGFRLNGTATGNISCFDASLDLKLMASPCYQGTCGGNGSCVCLPGWTGYTDAVPMDTTEWPGGTVLSCGVNTVVVKCLWATAIIPAIAIAAILYPTVRENLRIHHRSRARRQGGTPWYVK